MKAAAVYPVWLLAAAVTPTAAAEPTANVRVQELEGIVADAEARADSEARERQKCAAALEETGREISSLREEAARFREASAGLERRSQAALAREEGVRAELDLCMRTRASVEEQRNRCRTELQTIDASRQSEIAEKDRQLEECRGLAADLEAHKALLTAEKRGLERQNQEKAEELACNYDALVESTRRELAACQGRLAQWEAAGIDIEAFQQWVGRDRAQVVQAAAAREEAARVRTLLTDALRGDVEKAGATVVGSEGRVGVSLAVDALSASRGAELRPGARDTLKRLASVLQAESHWWVLIQGRVPAGVAEGGKKTPNPWELSSGPADRVARLLSEEGIARDRLIAVSAPPVSSSGAGPRAGVVVIDLVLPERLTTVLPELQPPGSP